MSFHPVAKIDELDVGQSKIVQVGEKILAIFRCEDGYYALDDRCSHRGGPLSEGKLEGYEVTCPWHAGKFDVRTGKPSGGVVKVGQACYRIRVSEKNIEVDVP